MIKLKLPSVTALTPGEQIAQLKSYLFQLVQELEWAFSTLEQSDDDSKAPGADEDLQRTRELLEAYKSETIDEICTTGQTGIWTWRKWADGTAECWGKKTVITDVNGTWGGIYYSSLISESNVDFPFTFISAPTVSAQLSRHKQAGVLCAPASSEPVTPSRTKTGYYAIIRPTSAVNAEYVINYSVKGKWK